MRFSMSHVTGDGTVTVTRQRTVPCLERLNSFLEFTKDKVFLENQFASVGVTVCWSVGDNFNKAISESVKNR